MKNLERKKVKVNNEQVKKMNRGITIVSLIVAIISLIVLAGITAHIVVGDNGILQRQKQVEENQRIAMLTQDLKQKALKTKMSSIGNQNDLTNTYLDKLKTEKIVEQNDIDASYGQYGTFITVDDKYVYFIEEKKQDIIVTYKGVEGKVEPQIMYVDVDNSTSSITVNVHAKYADKYNYYIKENQEEEYRLISQNNPSNVYEYKNLTQSARFNIKIEAINDNGIDYKTVVRGTGVIPTGTITIGEEEWDDSTETASFEVSTTATGYYLQYTLDPENNNAWQDVINGGYINGVEVGQTIFVRLWDKTNQADEAYKSATVNQKDGRINLATYTGTTAYPNQLNIDILENLSKRTLTVASSNDSIATATVQTTGNNRTGTLTIRPGKTSGTTTITLTSVETESYKQATATYTVTVQKGTLTVLADNYSGAYDGVVHGITLSCSTTDGGQAATITYCETQNGTYTAQKPTYSAVGTYTTYYKVELDGYEAVTGSKTVTITKQQVNPVTNVQITTAGIVTWTASSNATGYEISIDNNTWTAATSGVDYLSTITASKGARTVYVRAINSNTADYTTPSSNASKQVTVYSVSLTKGAGVDYVSGAGNYIGGATATIDATVGTGYTWNKWTQTTGSANVSTTKAYSTTISADWAYTANATANTYVVTANANGGTIPTTTGWTNATGNTTSTKNLTYDSQYGNLPAPTRNGYTFKGWSLLPDGYEQVEYIESNGTQNINTGVNGGNNNLKIGVKYSYSETPKAEKYVTVFSAYETEDYNTTRIINYGPNKTYFNLNIKAFPSPSVFINRTANTIYEEEIYRKNDVVYYKSNAFETAIKNNLTQGTEINKNIYIFARNADAVPVKLYGMKIYNNDVLIRNFVPCINKATNKAGLYDLVEGTFYGKANVSGDDFTYGERCYVTAQTKVDISSNHTLIAKWGDETAPTKPTVVGKYESNDATYTSDTWTNKKVYNVVSTTEAGSGVEKFQYSTDNGANWADFGTAIGITQNGTSFSAREGWTVSNGRNITVIFRAIDNDGNISEVSDAFKIKYDTQAPTLETDLRSATYSDLSTWKLSGGAYIDDDGSLVLPTSSSKAYSFFEAHGVRWDTNYEYKNLYTGSESSGSLEKFSYFTSDFEEIATVSGWRGARAHYTTTKNKWLKSRNESQSATTAYYTKVTFYWDTSATYVKGPYAIRNFKFLTNENVTSQGKLIYLTKTDELSDVKQVKYLSGTKTVADFTNAGEVVTDRIEITENGTYTIYIEDNAGNNAVSTITISNIDRTKPTASITSTNNVAASQTATLTVGDNVAATKYYFGKTNPENATIVWTDVTTSTISATVNSEGTWYLGVKDAANNMTVVSKQFFKTTLIPNKGSISPTTILTASGEQVTLPTPSSVTGYTFGGWYTNEELTTPVTLTSGKYTPSATATLYGKWTANSYTVVFNKNAQDATGTMANLSVSYNEEKNLTANAFTRSGYTFFGWSLNAEGTGHLYANQQSIINLANQNNATVNMYAVWKSSNFTVQFNGNGSTSGSTANQTVAYGTNTALTQNGFEKQGYSFTNWNNGIETHTNSGSIKINANILNKTSEPQLANSSDNATALVLDGGWRIATTFDNSDESRKVIDITNGPSELITKGFEIVGKTDKTLDIAQCLVPVTEGNSYTLSVYAKGSGTLSLQVGINQYERRNIQLSDVAEWTRYSLTFTAGTINGISNGKTNIFFGNLRTAGTLQICGMKLEEGTVATPYVDNTNIYKLKANWSAASYTVTANANGGTLPTTTGWTNASGNGSATKTVTYDGTYGTLPTPTRKGYTFGGWTKNILDELNSTNYSVDNYKDRTTSEFKNDGNFGNMTNQTYIRFNASETNIDTYWHITSRKLKNVEAGKTYTFSFYIRSQNAGATQYIRAEKEGDLCSYIEWNDGTKTKLSENKTFNNDGNWYLISETITVPAGVTGVRVIIGNDLPNLCGANAYLDIGGIQFTEGSTVPPYYITNTTQVKTERNHNINAIWNANSYTVTVNANGGTIPTTTGWTNASGNTTATKSVSYDGTYGTLPTPTKTGYTFAGWIVDENLISTNVNDWEQSGIYDVDGTNFSNSSNNAKARIRLKDYLKVSPNTVYKITVNNSENIRIRNIWTYDENKNFISRMSNSNVNEIVFTTPSNCKYIRTVLHYSDESTEITVNNLQDANLYLTETVTNTTYVTLDKAHVLRATWTANDYTVTVNANGGTLPTTTGWTNASGNTTATKTVTYDGTYGTLPTPTRTGYTFAGWNGKNLFNVNDVLDDYYIKYSTGNPIEFNNSNYLWSCSNYIEIEAGKTYTFNPNSTAGNSDTAHAVYDENKNFIKSFETGQQTMVMPANAKYIRVSYRRSDSSNMQLEEGSTATTYEPYYVTDATNVTQAKAHELKAIWVDNVKPVITSATASTAWDIENYVDFNATDAGTGIVGYNISTSNTVEPTTWIPVVSAVESTTETKYENDAAWARVFHHNTHYGTVLYSNKNNSAEVKSSNTVDKYSVLGNLENYKNTTGWEFMLQYPDLSSTKYNRWTQTSNPVTTKASITDYSPIHIDWASSGWGGLAVSSGATNTFMDGSPGASTWYYAIGCYVQWYGGIPGPNPMISNVNLWSRIDNLTTTTSTNLTRRIGDLKENTTYYVWVKDSSGNTANRAVTINKVDKTAPTASITSTNNVANTQTATLTIGDNVGATKYYWGDSDPSANTTITWNDITSTTSTTIEKNVNAEGTYYLAVQDAAGNRQVVSKKFYNTTLIPNNGSVSPTNVITNDGNSFTLPTPSEVAGYTFAGWYTNEELTIAVTLTNGKYVPTDSVTLYGKWTENVYAITLDKENGTGGTDTVYEKYDTGYYLTYNNGTVSNQMTTTENRVTIPSRDGYTFTGYYASGGSQYIDENGYIRSTARTNRFTKDDKLYAQWTANTYTVTANANGGTIPTTTGWTNASGNETATKNVTYDGTYGTLPEPTKTGYTFAGWNGKNLLDMNDWMNDTDFVVYNGTATKGNNSLTLTSTGDDCYTMPYYGENLYKIQVKPSTTYTLSWNVDNSNAVLRIFAFHYAPGSTTGSTFDSVTQSNVTKLTFTTRNDAEYISFRLGLRYKNETVTFTNLQLEEGSEATPYEPYYVTSSTKVTQAKAHELKAIWKANNYTVTFNPNGGTMNSSTATTTYTQSYDSLITMDNPTRPGYEFMGWVSDKRTNVTTAGYWTYTDSVDPLTGNKLEIINEANHRLNGYAGGTKTRGTPTSIPDIYVFNGYSQASTSKVNYTTEDPNPLNNINATSFTRITRTSYNNAVYSNGPSVGLPYLHRDVNQVYIIVARFPKGWMLTEGSNYGGSGKWLTSIEGTGKWETYIYSKASNKNDRYMSAGYFYLLNNDSSSNTTHPTMDVAYLQAYYTNKQSSTASVNKFKIGAENETLTALWQAVSQTVTVTPNSSNGTYKVTASNLFDKTDMITTEAKIIQTTNSWAGASSIQGDNTYFISGWIPVVPGATYKITGATEDGLVEWSVNAKNVTLYYASTQATAYSNDTNFTAPTTYTLYSNNSIKDVTYEYMRFHAKTSDIDNIRLEMVDSPSYNTTKTLKFPNNATVVVTTTPNSGYSATVSKTSGLGTFSGTTTGTLANVAGNATTTNLAVNFTANTYTVTVNANGGTIPSTTGWTGTGSTATKSVTYGSAYGTLPTPTREGYTFEGWNGKNLFNYEEILKNDSSTVSLQELNGIQTISWVNNSVAHNQRFLQGHFKDNTQYTISGKAASSLANWFVLVFHYTDGTFEWINYNHTSKYPNENTFIDINYTSLENKTLDYISGAYSNSERMYIDVNSFQIEEGTTATPYEPYLVTDSTNVTQAKSHELKAIWTANEYTVKFNANGGTGSMSDEAMTYDTEKALTANAFTRTGYTFAGWSTSASDKNLVYDNQEYTATRNGSGYPTVKQYSIAAPFATGEVYQVEVDVKGSGVLYNYFWGDTNYLRVDSWTQTDGTNTKTGTNGDGHNEITLTDTYKHYSTRFVLGSNGDGSKTKYLLFRLDSGNATAYIKNVRFYKVSASSTAYANTQTVKNLATTGTVDLYAIWKANTYTVTLNNQNATTAGTGSVQATFDSELTNITVPTKTGYTFKGYYSNTDASNLTSSSIQQWDSTSRVNLTNSGTGNNWAMTSSDAGTHIQAKIKITDSNISNKPSVEFNDITITPYRVIYSENTWTYYIDFDITEQMVSRRGDTPYDTNYRFIDFYGTTTSAIVTVENITKFGKKYYDNTGKGVYISDFTGNSTLYAKWTPNTYTVTANSNGGTIPTTTGWTGTGSTATKTVTYDSAYGTLPTPTRTGYTFAGWNGKNKFSGLVKGICLVDSTGNQYEKANSAGTKYIKIDLQNNDNYFLSGLTDTLYNCIYVYNENKEYMGRTYNEQKTNRTINTSNLIQANQTGVGGTISYIRIIQIVSTSNGNIDDIDGLNIQLEEGATATAYEPYFVTSSTNVRQAKAHELKAIWTPNELTFANQTITKTFNTNSQTANVTVASNGTGTYTYSKVSGESDITISSAGVITIPGGKTVGSYSVVIRATDSNSGATKDATYTITINKANISSTVSISDYYYGGTLPTPSVSSNPGSGTVTYYYNTTNSSSNGIAWSNVTSSKTLAVGTYYMYAIIGATTNYNSKTTATVAFQVKAKTAEWEIETDSGATGLSVGDLVKPKNASVENEKFYVIGIGTQADPVVTLLAQYCVDWETTNSQNSTMGVYNASTKKTPGTLAFREDWEASDANIYSASDIKSYVDAYVSRFTAQSVGMTLQDVEINPTTHATAKGRLMWGSANYDWDVEPPEYISGTEEINQLIEGGFTNILFGTTNKMNYWLGSPREDILDDAMSVYGREDIVASFYVDNETYYALRPVIEVLDSRITY